MALLHNKCLSPLVLLMPQCNLVMLSLSNIFQRSKSCQAARLKQERSKTLLEGEGKETLRASYSSLITELYP